MATSAWEGKVFIRNYTLLRARVNNHIVPANSDGSFPTEATLMITMSETYKRRNL